MMDIALAVRGIHKRFGTMPVLKGVSFEARRGEVVSLIGRSGSGKSTLLRCINYLETPDLGDVIAGSEVLISGKDAKGRRILPDRHQLERVRRKLGMVFQNFNLWPHMTVLQNVIEGPVNVLLKPKAQAEEEARALLERVGLADKVDWYPAHLSGGQQQRAAIARAVAMEPTALLFDEPTSALDPELVGEVIEVIRSLAAEGRTMILVTHEMALARDISTRVIFLNQGLIEEEGPPDQIMANPTSVQLRQFLKRG